MSTPTEASIGATRPRLTAKNRVGLVLAALLGIADIIGAFVPSTDPNDPDAAGPPIGILIVGAVLGVITILAVVYTWRTANRIGSRVIAGTRIISALSSVPAFFVAGIPAALVASVGLSIVVTITAVVLVLSRPAPPR